MYIKKIKKLQHTVIDYLSIGNDLKKFVQPVSLPSA